MRVGLNVGSGQRRFTSTADVQWINIDAVSRVGHEPDLVADGAELPMFGDATVDFFVLHHCLEHETLSGADRLIKEASRVLKPDGSLLVFIPDIRALAGRWLAGGISDYIYVVNLMGAYMGDVADLHKWHYTPESLTQKLIACAPWHRIGFFDWRVIPGSDFARDWWILAIEAIK